MKVFKFFFKLIVVLILIVAGLIFYAFKIEPYLLTVNKYSLNEKSTNAIKIIQFSDLHIKNNFTYKNLNKVVNAINRLNPDVVIFTGDLYDNYAKYHDDINIIKELKKIKANYAKIAIWGNRDYGGGASRYYENIINEADFTLLKNENYNLTVKENKKILITGLDDSILGIPKLPASKIKQYDYRILLSHEPDNVTAFTIDDYQLILSGHSHGGQVNIPFLSFINQKALSTTLFVKKYSKGMIELTPTTKIYVNSGIGTTHLSARFQVVPEITMFTINL